jgi:hypothetical protein
MAIAPRIPPRPVAKPAMVAKPNANPFTGGKTTSMAQRQANQPFKSATKPAAPKVNPLAGQPTIPPNTMRNPTPEDMARFGTPTQPQPFNPQPNPGQQPGFGGGKNYAGGQPTFKKLFDSQPTFIDPNTGLPSTGPGISNDFSEGEMFNQYGPGMSNQPTNTQGGGIFGGNLPGMVGNAVSQGLGGMFGGLGQMLGNAGQQALQQGIQGGLGQMFGGNMNNDGLPPGAEWQLYGSSAGQQPQNMYNSYSSTMNTNPSQQYNGNLDLSGMMSPQGQQAPQNMSQMGASGAMLSNGGKSSGQSNSNTSFGGGKGGR